MYISLFDLQIVAIFIEYIRTHLSRPRSVLLSSTASRFAQPLQQDNHKTLALNSPELQGSHQTKKHPSFGHYPKRRGGGGGGETRIKKCEKIFFFPLFFLFFFFFKIFFLKKKKKKRNDGTSSNKKCHFAIHKQQKMVT